MATEKGQKYNIDQQTLHRKLKIKQHEPFKQTEGELMFPGRIFSSSSTRSIHRITVKRYKHYVILQWCLTPVYRYINTNDINKNMNSLYKQMGIKTNRALFMFWNLSGHHNTKLNMFTIECIIILHKTGLLISFDVFINVFTLWQRKLRMSCYDEYRTIDI